MKKILFVLSISLTLLCLSFTVFAQGTAKITETAKEGIVLDEIEPKVKSVIKKYFELLYTSLETLEIPDFSEIMSENDKTLKVKKSIEFSIKARRLRNSKNTNTKITVEYISFENAGQNRIVKVTVSGEHNYNDMPSDIDAGFAGIKYKFTLNKENIITDIETDVDDFEGLDSNIEWFYDENDPKNATKTYEEKLDDVIEKGIARLKKMNAYEDARNSTYKIARKIAFKPVCTTFTKKSNIFIDFFKNMVYN